MPRPKSKIELIEASNQMFSKLMDLIDSLDDNLKQGTFQFEDRDQNVRDVVTHLFEWHDLMLIWVDNNLNGEHTPFLPNGYNWKTYPQMNIEINLKHKNTSLSEGMKLLKNSHEEVMKVIESLTNEELFIKKYFNWTGSTSLGSYCVSCTSSHYDWGVKKIKKHIKSYK